MARNLGLLVLGLVIGALGAALTVAAISPPSVPTPNETSLRDQLIASQGLAHQMQEKLNDQLDTIALLNDEVAILQKEANIDAQSAPPLGLSRAR